jgi:hypothetical protein
MGISKKSKKKIVKDEESHKLQDLGKLNVE